MPVAGELIRRLENAALKRDQGEFTLVAFECWVFERWINSPATGMTRRVVVSGTTSRLIRMSLRSSGSAEKNSSIRSLRSGSPRAGRARLRRRCTGKLAQNGKRGSRIGRKARRNRSARLRVDRVDQPQRQLDKLGFLFDVMNGLLDVKIREDAQQGRAYVDAIAACQIDQAVQGIGRGKLHND